MCIRDRFEDEYLTGYFGRIAKLNRFENVTKLHMFLSQKTHQNIARSTPILICLSKLLQIDPIDLWKNHTAYTFKLENDNPENIRDLLARSHYSTRNRNFYSSLFCSQCLQDDLERYGYTYWRRVHQTSESKFCNKHSTIKLYKAFENDRLFYSPAWHLNNEAYRELA